MIVSRRSFLRFTAAGLVPAAVRGPRSQSPKLAQRPDTGRVAADTLVAPIGGMSRPLGPLDNDPGVVAIERRLRCSCGCTLDVYTCRTTDFSCTFSPEMHRLVVQQVQQGANADQILAWFVAQPEYGEKVLMSPPARGFNLAGYLIPGLLVAAVALALAAWLAARQRPALAAAGGDGTAAPPGSPDAEQLERLRRALDDVES
ncbi:MAG TPA: cytochrome c-type biogenesis protein CcmH [Gemmatimonadales bacterium]|jgi:cytochrome c-type biogenesis protein CcmH/NrfF